MNFIFSENIKFQLLNIFLFLYLFSFLRNLSNLYYPLLFIVVVLLLVVFFIENNSLKLNSITNTYFMFLISYLILTISSIIYMERFGYDIYSLINGLGRLWLSAVLIILIYPLILNNKKILFLQNYYVFFIILAALSIFLQHFIGQIKVLGDPYGAPRMGLIGYSSITGNVTSFAPTVPIVSIIIMMNNKIIPILKTVLLGVVISASILTMGKSGLMNAIIAIIFVFSISFYKKNFRVIFYLLITTLFIFLVSETLLFAVITQFVNTTGIEFGRFKLSGAVEFQPFLPRITDRLFGNMTDFTRYNFVDLIFGIGIKGGGGALGIENITSHNTYIDMMIAGGFVHLTLFLLMVITLQASLWSHYQKYNNTYSLTFFMCNLSFLFNLLLMNGAIYHPAISFIFWISILSQITTRVKN